MVETDVRLTADGELFLFHDETGFRTTNVSHVYPLRAGDPITSFTAGELRRLDAGSYAAAKYAGEPVLFLADLPAALGFDVGVNLEVKTPAGSPGVEEALASMLAEHEGWVRLRETRQVTVSSFDPAAVGKAAGCGLPAWQLVSADPDARLLEGLDPRVQGIVADHLSLTDDGAAAVRAAGLGLWVYTVNAPADTAKVLTLGVDAVITDFPEALRTVLGGSRELSVLSPAG